MAAPGVNIMCIEFLMQQMETLLGLLQLNAQLLKQQVENSARNMALCLQLSSLGDHKSKLRRRTRLAKRRRYMLQAKLNSHKTGRSKKRLPAEYDASQEEDLQITKRMLELMEESRRRNADSMLQINTNIASIANTVQDGCSLMRQLLLQRQFAPPVPPTPAG